MTHAREFEDGQLVPGTRYRVLGVLGVGGMGTVYDVEHVELGKRFVLKALLRNLAQREDLVARLRNEWRALGRLEHPNIVNVTDAGSTATGTPFFVMERLEGETLLARLRRVRRLTVRDALNIAAAISDALGAAHDIGVIHRDVKPPNVFLPAAGGVKLLDFGVAKSQDVSVGGQVTARGIAVGTPRYMSPEQARGERLDGRSDIYAVGLLLFEMIAGAGPFEDVRDANEVILAHIARPPPYLAQLVPSIPYELNQLVGSMLAKDCRERPPSARLLAQTLRDLAERFTTGGVSAQRQSAPPPQPQGFTHGVVPVTQRLPDAPAQPTSHLAPTRPDGVAGRVALQQASTVAATYDAAHTTRGGTQRMLPSPSGIPTQRSPYSTGVTYEGMPPPVSSHPAMSADTLLDPLSGALSAAPENGFAGVIRTERLLDTPPGSAADLAPTRTRVPIGEVAQNNSTPPPVVEPRADIGRRSGALVALLIVTVLALIGGGAIALWRLKFASPSDAKSAAVEPPRAVPPVTPPPVSIPAPEPEPRDVAPSASASALASNTPAPARPAPATTPRLTARKSAQTANVSAASETSPAGTSAPKKALPSSGL